jgi:hypothetical protein
MWTNLSAKLSQITVGAECLKATVWIPKLFKPAVEHSTPSSCPHKLQTMLRSIIFDVVESQKFPSILTAASTVITIMIECLYTQLMNSFGVRYFSHIIEAFLALPFSRKRNISTTSCTQPLFSAFPIDTIPINHSIPPTGSCYASIA